MPSAPVSRWIRKPTSLWRAPYSCHALFFFASCQMIFQTSSLRTVSSKRSQERGKMHRPPWTLSQTKKNRGGKIHRHCISHLLYQVTYVEVSVHIWKGKPLATRSHWSYDISWQMWIFLIVGTCCVSVLVTIRPAAIAHKFKNISGITHYKFSFSLTSSGSQGQERQVLLQMVIQGLRPMEVETSLAHGVWRHHAHQHPVGTRDTEATSDITSYSHGPLLAAQAKS